jgi:hypothetical protein
MRIFGTAEAAYFCQNFTPEIGDSERDIKEFFKRNLDGISFLDENTSRFNEYRSCLLREVERDLFLSASQYRRFLDLMIPSASHWAFVTAYYGSFYAARAILGLLGCHVFKKHVIDVAVGAPGRQRLAKRLIGSGINQEPGNGGSHRDFWAIYYRSVTPLNALIPPHLTMALNPVSGQSQWLIEKRNEVNYQAYSASDLINDFQTNFTSINFPRALPGILNTQYAVMEAMIELAYIYATQFGISTDSLSFFGAESLKRKVKEQVYRPKTPSLIDKTRKNDIFV